MNDSSHVEIRDVTTHLLSADGAKVMAEISGKRDEYCVRLRIGEPGHYFAMTLSAGVIRKIVSHALHPKAAKQ